MRAALIPLLCCLAGSLAAFPLMAAPGTDRLIVKFRSDRGQILALRPELQLMEAGRTRRLSALAGVDLVPHRASDFGQIVRLPRSMAISEVEAIARKVAASPDVLYAEPDRRLFAMRLPSDPRFPEQWSIQNLANVPGGISLPAAWDITTGNSSIVVAVVDSGILSHADLMGRTLPGYDFVSDATIANDGDGRDADPSDPGDWVSAAEAASGGAFGGCDVADSSWHGTHVAGIVGAAGDNGLGVAGIGWGTRILPVRAMGKCGGYTSDIADGLRWAAGLPVAGVPVNFTPAKVLNLSLGGAGPCSMTEQNAIDAVVSAGAVVVVAAGNEAQNANNVSPANCHNVVVVAATDRTGSRASYTNYGRIVDVSAPGGDLAYGGGGILSTGDGGTTTPIRDNGYALRQGTSMAVPHVSGVVSLMSSINPALTPSAIKQILRATARAFPTGTVWDCRTTQCGAGIVDAPAAIYSSSPALVPVGVNGIAAGTPTSLTLRATIKAMAEDSGKRVNLYIGARLGEQWYLRTQTDWVPWSGGPLPVFGSAIAGAVMELLVGQDVDVSTLTGTEIFVGYGVDEADLLNRHKYGLIYTIE